MDKVFEVFYLHIANTLYKSPCAKLVQINLHKKKDTSILHTIVGDLTGY